MTSTATNLAQAKGGISDLSGTLRVETDGAFPDKYTALKRAVEALEKRSDVILPQLVGSIRSVGIYVNREFQVARQRALGLDDESERQGIKVGRERIFGNLESMEKAISSVVLDLKLTAPLPFSKEDADELRRASTLLESIRRSDDFEPSQFALSALSCVGSAVSHSIEIYTARSKFGSSTMANAHQEAAKASHASLLRDLKSYMIGMRKQLSPDFDSFRPAHKEIKHRRGGPRPYISIPEDKLVDAAQHRTHTALVEELGISAGTVHKRIREYEDVHGKIESIPVRRQPRPIAPAERGAIENETDHPAPSRKMAAGSDSSTTEPMYTIVDGRRFLTSIYKQRLAALYPHPLPKGPHRVELPLRVLESAAKRPAAGGSANVGTTEEQADAHEGGRKTGRPANKTIMQMAAMREGGASFMKIAHYFNMKTKTVRRYLEKRS
jgi:hypothetical protein